jgi:hypothetical protein
LTDTCTEKLYEWVTTGLTAIPRKRAELRLIGQNYKAFNEGKGNAMPLGWNIREGTVARIEYCTKWAVIRVLKLKQEDVGPKELWLEFREPKAKVLEGFLKSFKNIPWPFYKVYPEEM